MANRKLEHLRALAAKTDLNDKALQAFLDSGGAHGGDKREHVAPYAGISSFLRAPLNDGFEGLDIALVGVPFDLAVTNRPGTRFGPQQVRDCLSWLPDPSTMSVVSSRLQLHALPIAGMYPSPAPMIWTKPRKRLRLSFTQSLMPE